MGCCKVDLVTCAACATCWNKGIVTAPSIFAVSFFVSVLSLWVSVLEGIVPIDASTGSCSTVSEVVIFAFAFFLWTSVSIVQCVFFPFDTIQFPFILIFPDPNKDLLIDTPHNCIRDKFITGRWISGGYNEVKISSKSYIVVSIVSYHLANRRRGMEGSGIWSARKGWWARQRTSVMRIAAYERNR